MGITQQMRDMTPEERKDYMRALRSKQTAPGGFAAHPDLARQAQAKSVATRKARHVDTHSGITELDAPPTQETA